MKGTKMGVLDGKVAIVTGATKAKGLGKAIADKMAAEGAKVALTGRENSKEGVEANVAEIQGNGGEAMSVLVDVSDPEQVDAAVAAVADAWGQVDILVNNAGVGFGSAVLEENDDKAWGANYAVNVRGTMELCRGVIPHMEKAGGGAIVNVASTAGIAASVGMPYPYVATKHGVVGATKVLALELASKGIRANVVAPGAINTDMLQQAYAAIAEAGGISVEEAAAAENASIPLGRPAEPGEIADAIVFLASPRASYITGIVLPVAGGMAPGI
jgi:NAD(P)-dependent dehydrogenase (short-subunit alcohol dehydrogenase family)